MRALSRRRLLTSLAACIGAYGVAKAAPVTATVPPFTFKPVAKPVAGIVEQVIPEAGVPTRVAFGDSIQKLIAAGVIDPDKFRGTAEPLPDWVERLLQAPSDAPLRFDKATAPFLVELLWPIGLANKTAFNRDSPVARPGIPNFASTGGWTLGHAPNGYVYFNQVNVVRLTAGQQAMVLQAAKRIYRPCCDNSTLFQDCNHGSAMLGLLELAAAQGATLAGLYRVALAANSYWFPDHYARTALYFSHFHRRPWPDVEPPRILSAAFSSASGWSSNVSYPLTRANIALPGQANGQQGC